MESQKDLDIQCSICANPFNEKVNKPMSLQCGHTLCDVCLNKLQKKECPTCKKPILNQPSVNFQLQHVLELYKNIKPQNMAALLKISDSIQVIRAENISCKAEIQKNLQLHQVEIQKIINTSSTLRALFMKQISQDSDTIKDLKEEVARLLEITARQREEQLEAKKRIGVLEIENLDLRKQEYKDRLPQQQMARSNSNSPSKYQQQQQVRNVEADQKEERKQLQEIEILKKTNAEQLKKIETVLALKGESRATDDYILTLKQAIRESRKQLEATQSEHKLLETELQTLRSRRETDKFTIQRQTEEIGLLKQDKVNLQLQLKNNQIDASLIEAKEKENKAYLAEIRRLRNLIGDSTKPTLGKYDFKGTDWQTKAVGVALLVLTLFMMRII